MSDSVRSYTQVTKAPVLEIGTRTIIPGSAYALDFDTEVLRDMMAPYGDVNPLPWGDRERHEVFSHGRVIIIRDHIHHEIQHERPTPAFEAALESLDALGLESDESENIPDQRAVDNARTVLDWIKHHPRLMIYPTPQSGVAVDAIAMLDTSHRAVVICEGDGSGSFFEQQNDEANLRIHCSDVLDERMRDNVVNAIRKMHDQRLTWPTAFARPYRRQLSHDT